jgi:hypothetical protein
MIAIPANPNEPEPSVWYTLDPTYSVDGGRDLGKVRLPLVRAVQSEAENEIV